jgi:hypothetical protein
VEVVRLQSSGQPKSVARAARAVRRRLDKAERFDAAVMAWSEDCSLQEVGALSGIALHPGNVREHAARLRELARNKRPLSRMYEALEELVGSRSAAVQALPGPEPAVPVFVAGGNGGVASLNLYTLCRGVNVVGALDPSGLPAPYSANNTLVDWWAPGTVTIRRVEGGYNITGGTDAQVRDKQLCRRGRHHAAPGTALGTISATSVACPLAAAAALRP